MKTWQRKKAGADLLSAGGRDYNGQKSAPNEDNQRAENASRREAERGEAITEEQRRGEEAALIGEISNDPGE